MALGVGPISSGAISSRPSSGGAVAYTLSGAHGTYSITGQSASFTVARNLSGANGTYAITGQAASFGVARQLSGANGTYTINGQPATMTYTPGGSAVPYALSGEYGTYAITGQSATMLYTPGSTEPVKVGGDDVPRYEIWEKKRRFENKDKALEDAVAKAYRQMMGEEPESSEVAQVLEEVREEATEAQVTFADYSGVAEWLQAQESIIARIIEHRRIQAENDAELDDEEAILLLI